MKVGIVGCGTIGRKVAEELDKGAVPNVQLAALSSRTLETAREFATTLGEPPPVVTLAELVALADVVIEAAGRPAVEGIARAALESGKDVMVLSCGALLDSDDLVALAQEHKASIHVPSGAIIGLDGILSATAGRIDSITMVSRKPPGGLKGAPGVAEVDMDAVTEPMVVYEGPVREACRLFPANVNVSAAVSMAGLGPDATKIRIMADPTVTRNTHSIAVEGEFGRLEVKIENVPTENNPRTGVLTALSVLASLKKLASPLKVGT